MISDELKQLFASEAVQKVTIYTDIPGTGTETRTITNVPTAVFRNGTANPILSLKVGVNAQFQGATSVTYPGQFIGRTSTTVSINGTDTTATYGRTAYKGEYDISGSLKVTHNLVTYNGSEEWTTVDNRYCVPLDAAYRKSQDPASNMWSTRMISTLGSDYSLLAMPLALTAQMTLAEWKTHLSQTHLEVLLERVTPQTYTVPSLSLSTVSGDNTISADSGDIIELEYTATKSLQITEADIMSGTFSINRSVIEGSSLALGTCIASELSMTLINYDNRFDGISWSGSELTVELGVEGSNETLPMGVFYVDGTPKSRDTITLTALDGMTKLDKMVRNVGWWPPGYTLANLVAKCCTECDVTLATDLSNYPNASWFPYDQIYSGYTYRQLLSFAIALMGKCAWMDGNGQLRVGFAERLGSFEHSAVVGIAIVGQAIVGNSSGSGLIADTFGPNKRFNSDYEDSSITITGISYTRDDTVYRVGSDDYVFDLSGNPFLDYADYSVAPSYTDVLANLYTSGLVGFMYTPISMSVVPCPHIFPMDWVSYQLSDYTNIYALVTDFTFVLNGANQIASRGESPEERAKASLTQSVNYVQNVVNATSDFVLEEGTKDGWTYRKWKSGNMECWYKSSLLTVDCSSPWNGQYYGSIATMSFPYSFTEMPVVQQTVSTENGAYWWSPQHGTTSTTGKVYLYGLESKNDVQAYRNIYAFGKYK